MSSIKIVLATKKDKNQLLDYFKHYKIKEVLDNRIECYLSHNFTVVAKDKDKIVGTLQWYIKEDPRRGIVEFEEVHVLQDYRSKRIGASLVKFAIQSVKNYFKKIQTTPRRIFLFVSEENEAAKTLYESNDFKLFSVVGNLFSETEKELLYSLDL